MSYRRFILGLCLLLPVFGCTKKLSKNELADVLVDMYIYDQLFTRANLHRQQDSISVYRSVFQKHNCTEKQFQAGIMRYSANPKQIQAVYAMADEKIKLLKKNYEEVVGLQYKEKAMQMKMDSLYRYPPDTMYRHIFNRSLLWDMEFADDAFQSAAIADSAASRFNRFDTPLKFETAEEFQPAAILEPLPAEPILERAIAPARPANKDTSARRLIRREAVRERQR